MHSVGGGRKCGGGLCGQDIGDGDGDGGGDEGGEETFGVVGWCLRLAKPPFVGGRAAVGGWQANWQPESH